VLPLSDTSHLAYHVHKTGRKTPIIIISLRHAAFPKRKHIDNDRTQVCLATIFFKYPKELFYENAASIILHPDIA